MEKIKYRPPHVACKADAAVRNRAPISQPTSRVVHRLVCRSTAVRGLKKSDKLEREYHWLLKMESMAV